LHEIIAERGSFIHPSKKFPPPLASSLTKYSMDPQALSQSPSGLRPPTEMKTCPSSMSQVCSMGFSYRSIRSRWHTFLTAVILTSYMRMPSLTWFNV